MGGLSQTIRENFLFMFYLPYNTVTKQFSFFKNSTTIPRSKWNVAEELDFLPNKKNLLEIIVEWKTFFEMCCDISVCV